VSIAGRSSSKISRSRCRMWDGNRCVRGGRKARGRRPQQAFRTRAAAPTSAGRACGRASFRR
jgi:hypothetical protein